MAVETGLKNSDPIVFRDAATYTKWKNVLEKKRINFFIDSKSLNHARVEFTNSTIRYTKILDEFIKSESQFICVQEFSHVFENIIKNDGRFEILTSGFNKYINNNSLIEDTGTAILIPKKSEKNNIIEFNYLHKQIKTQYPCDRSMTYAVVTSGDSTFIIGNIYLIEYPSNISNFKEIKEIANYGKDELINWLYAIHEIHIKYPMANVVIGGTFNESDISISCLNYIYEKFRKVSRLETAKSWGYDVVTVDDDNGKTEILRSEGKIGDQNIDWICIRSFIGENLNVQLIGSIWHKIAEDNQSICDDYKLLSNHRFLEITIS